MLRCLTKSYQPDGSFKVSDLDDTQGDAYRYGIWFLQEAAISSAKTGFGPSRISLIPKLFRAHRSKAEIDWLNDQL